MKAELVRIDANLPTKKQWDAACDRLTALGVQLMKLPPALNIKIEIGIPMPEKA